MSEFMPPPELSRRKLSVRRKNGRLILGTPMGRHLWVGLLCILLPAVFWAIQMPKAGKNFSMTSGIENRWLAALLDHILPDPSTAPLPMQLIALGFVMVGLLFLFHGLVTVVDKNGISTTHSLFFLPYYRAHIPTQDIISFSLSTNGSFSRANGEIEHLYCVIANCSAPPRLRFCGFPVKAGMAGKEVWQEWLAFSLPGENAGDYVISLVKEACSLPQRSDDSR
ncbi:MAG: hypothetical protein HYS18_04780 [Burkholderiales bacterium]|nr:hypothetical protein [Burkholderiales bacterium]